MSGHATYGTPEDSCICGCGGGACIPQRKYAPRTGFPAFFPHEQETIFFSVNGKCGYPLENALKKQYAYLDGGYEKVVVSSTSSTTIRLEVRPFPPT